MHIVAIYDRKTKVVENYLTGQEDAKAVARWLPGHLQAMDVDAVQYGDLKVIGRGSKRQIVPRTDKAALEKARALAWFDFKAEWVQRLERTNYLTFPDNPISDEDRAAVSKRRRLTYRIKDQIEDPDRARAVLDRVWRDFKKPKRSY